MKHIKTFESFVNEDQSAKGANLVEYVEKAAEQCDNQGGNGENLRQYGLPALAEHIDAYYGHNTSMGENIYTDATVAAFKKFVDSMVADEIEFNQAEEKFNSDGIWVLDGGLDEEGNWDMESLASARVLYHTEDFKDPKLQDYKEDGMVWVEITKGEIDVKQY